MSNKSPEQQTDRELISATVDAITATVPVGLQPAQAFSAAARFAQTLAKQPQVVARRAAQLVTEQAKVLAGTSTVEPGPKDRRFTDEAFQENAVYKRLAQSYLAMDQQVHGLVADLDIDEKSRFAH